MNDREFEKLKDRLKPWFVAYGSGVETGTFTPTYFGSATAGVTTYTIQVGAYTRIGDRVDFAMHVAWTAVTGTGNATMGGLPFTSRSTSNLYTALSIWWYAITYAAGNGVTAYLGSNTTEFTLWTAPASNAAAAALAIEAAGEIIIAGTYFI